jgi:hypothetical protein
VNANCAGGPMVTSFFPEVVQPTMKRIAIRAEIPKARDTPQQLNRKMLNIAAILFGLTWLQERWNEMKLNPGPDR